MARWVLDDHVEMFLILESLVNLDDLGVVERGQDVVLLEQVHRVLHVVLADLLDDPREVGVVLHLGLVYDPERATADRGLG